MATFPKPLCELRVRWGEREALASRPASGAAEVRTPIPIPRPSPEGKPTSSEPVGTRRESDS